MLAFLAHRISPDIRWAQQLEALVLENGSIPGQPMGFPDDWEHRLQVLLDRAESGQRA